MSKLKQLDPRRTYRPNQLPNDLKLNQLKVLSAKQMKNGNTVKANPQRIVVGKSCEKVQVDLVTEGPNSKQTKG
jgi:hypothetical protein